MRVRTPLEWFRKLGLGDDAELHPAVAEAIERTDEQRAERLERRERVAEVSLGLTTLLAAAGLPLAVPGSRPLDPWLLAALIVAFAVTQRVQFHDGAGYSAPTQLVFVPMMLLLPPAYVPLAVVAGMTAASADRFARRELHPQRIAVVLADSWYAVGPALVLALADPSPSWRAVPLYAAALVVQFAFDLAASVVRDWFVSGLGADLGLPLVAWTWLVDGLLSTVGLLAALAARDEPFGALLVLPLVALLAIFSRERSARIDQSLELSRAYRGTTLLLSDVLNDEDEYTAFHSRGVVHLSLAVADRLGLDARQRRNVEFGALLHDVGKIAIPREILHKPGKLSPDEWVVMETHTVEGQRMLDHVGGVLQEVGYIVRSSHERWDGRGYPDGLAGGAIPLESAIVAACDAFNAMTTDRPYRKALSLDEAIAELRTNSGTQFAPRVVDILVELISEDREMVGPATPQDEITLVVPDTPRVPS
jgi:putative nucleotidyltransferase with HDIG domain